MDILVNGGQIQKHAARAKSTQCCSKTLRSNFCQSISGLKELEVVPYGRERRLYSHEMHLLIYDKKAATKIDFRLCQCPITFQHLDKSIFIRKRQLSNEKFN